MKNNLPSYTELNQALQQTASQFHPSQVHGVISGLLCGKGDGLATWEKLLVSNESSAHKQKILHELHQQTEKQLHDFLFDFQLLLPDDGNDLVKRAEALTLWCQGFLTGLKMANVQIVDREPSDVSEAINDIIEIAKMNYEEVVSSEEDEVAFTELVEYVRMATILVYQEMHDDTSKNKSSHSSHHLH